MKTPPKRFLAVAIVPVFALLLSGCGIQTAEKPVVPASESVFNTPNPALQNNAPTPDPTATTAPLPPLPVDDKQAIDSEIQGIDQALQATDASLSDDTTDSELGL
jgi:hypothetical protein